MKRVVRHLISAFEMSRIVSCFGGHLCASLSCTEWLFKIILFPKQIDALEFSLLSLFCIVYLITLCQIFLQQIQKQFLHLTNDPFFLFLCLFITPHLELDSHDLHEYCVNELFVSPMMISMHGLLCMLNSIKLPCSWFLLQSPKIPSTGNSAQVRR